jgi:flagellar biosynthesis/type III secretory pathway protein FliH
MQFPVVRRRALFTSPAIPLTGPRVPANLLRSMETAEQLLSVAQTQCDTLLEQARRQAQELAFEATRDAQRQVWQGVFEQWEAFCTSRQHWQDIAHSLLLDVLRLALHRLKVDVPQEQQMQSSVRCVMQEWTGSQEALLRAHPLDMPVVVDLLGTRPHCQVVADESLRRGVCELHASSTLLRADFNASVDALVDVLSSSPTSKESS